MPEAELIRLYLAGQANACLTILYNRYYRKVYQKCLSMVRDVEAAKDHTQEIFLKAFAGLARFGYQSRFETWLFSITHHYCVDQLRRRKTFELVELTHETIHTQVDSTPEKDEWEGWLEQTWLSLPESSARLLRQKYLQGLSVEEMAVQNKTTLSAIKMRLYRARQAFREGYITHMV